MQATKKSDAIAQPATQLVRPNTEKPYAIARGSAPPTVALARFDCRTILGRMISKIILAVLAAVVVFVLYQRFTAVRVSGGDARTLVADGAMLIDVRSNGEFGGGHIEGAVNIPIQELARRMDELGDKDKKIVLYCQSGGRSAMAKRLLESNGFTGIHDMGGISRW